MEPTASTFDLVKELGDFSYELSALDRVWNILFPGKGKNWNHLHVNKYKRTFYITHVDGCGGLEVEPKKAYEQWTPWEPLLALLISMVNWLRYGNH